MRARQRLQGAVRLEPRPPRQPRTGGAWQQGAPRLPLGTPIREAPRADRDGRARRPGPGSERGPRRQAPTPRGAQATKLGERVAEVERGCLPRIRIEEA